MIMLNICINRKGKQRKSSVRRGARKENWPKRAKKTAVAGNRTLHHLQIRSIYGGLDRTYGVYIRSTKTHIRSYGYGTGGSVSYTVPDIRRTEYTAYIRSYGLGQPYIYGILGRETTKYTVIRCVVCTFLANPMKMSQVVPTVGIP